MEVPQSVLLMGQDNTKKPTFNIAYDIPKSEPFFQYVEKCILTIYEKATVNPQKIKNKTGYFEVKYVDEFGSEILVFSKKNGEGNFTHEKCYSVMQKIKRTVR